MSDESSEDPQADEAPGRWSVDDGRSRGGDSLPEDVPERDDRSNDDPSGDEPSGGDSASDSGGTTGADATDDADPSSDGEHEPTLAGVFGGRSEDTPRRPEIRPERISPEHALFVVLGVVLALFVLYRTAVSVFPA